MTDSNQTPQKASAMTSAIIAIVLAILAFLIPGIGILLAIGAIMMGRRASSLASAQGDDGAKTLARIAVVVSWLGLAVALFIVLIFGGGIFAAFL